MITLISFVVLIFSIIIHEVAHGYAADSMGDPTARLSGRLTLNPIPHIDLMGSIVIPAFLTFTGSPILFGWAKPVPYNPYNLRSQRWGEAFVAIAGPATNLFIALIFGLIVRFGIDPLPTSTVVFALIITSTNLFLGLFNLIPFPPLDGFTVLRAGLPWSISSHINRFEQHVRSGGAMSLVLFIVIFYYILAGPFSNLVTWLLGLITGIPQ